MCPLRGAASSPSASTDGCPALSQLAIGLAMERFPDWSSDVAA